MFQIRFINYVKVSDRTLRDTEKGNTAPRLSVDKSELGVASSFIFAIDLFEMKKTNGSVLWIRDKKKAKQLNKSR